MTRHWVGVVALLLAASLPFGAPSSEAARASPPSGSVSIRLTSFSVGIGVSRGEGVVLLNNGKAIAFTIRGFEVGSIGLSEVTMVGDVFHLTDRKDLPGRYTGGKTELAIGGGRGNMILRNRKGVVLVLQAVHEGVKLSFAVESIEIALK